MVIDAHAHVYPDKIAQKATDSVGDFYKLDMNADIGSVPQLLKLGEEAGIDMFLIHSVATTPHQVESIDNFIINTVNAHPDKFIGFATGHPDTEEPEAELERIMEAGLKGVKLHPDFQKFKITDPRMFRLYAFCEKNSFPILFHTGDYRYNYSNPHLVPELLEKFPDLKLICAHFGGWSEWDEAEKCLPGTGVKVDCSSSFFAISDERAVELINAFGENNVFFGSDFPMWDPGAELAILNRLDISEEAKEKIRSKNIIKFLNLNI